MRYIWLTALFLVVAVVSILGFRGSLSPNPPLEFFPDMDRQPKYKPQAESAFFSNRMTDRPLPANVVPRGREVEADPTFLAADDHMYRGFSGPLDLADPTRTAWIRGFPAGLEINAELLQRGRERYTVFCSPCHGQLGDGNGITKQYGMVATPTYHDERRRTMAEGEIFHVITAGRNTMLPYGDRVPVEDRWAIVAYVRALQRAQNGRVQDVPATNRGDLGL